MKNKILVLLPDGVGIRNYLYSSLFKDKEMELVLFHSFNNDSIAKLIETDSFEDMISIPKYKETLKEKIFRELICLTRLRQNVNIVNNSSLLLNWNWNQKGKKKKIFYKIIENIVPFIKDYSTILTLEKKYQKIIRQNSFYLEIKEILVNSKPTIVFCTHQRALSAATIFAAATDLGIKTTTVIYSWDNLPKARLALRSDHYFVWSEYMKNELQLYYPEITSHQIHVTGTPQFEFYQNKNNIINKDSFYAKYNLHLEKKIICFSGDDVKTSPDDPSYLRDIAEALVEANLQDEYQILFRKCPVDLSGRYDLIIDQYKDLIKEAPPLWFSENSKDWTSVCPTVNDVSLLVSTVFYSDIVVNVGSTMAFDFAMFDKPCVFINYDQPIKNVKEWSVQNIYKFQHFKSMPNKNAVMWLNSKAEIIDKLTSQDNNLVDMSLWKDTVLGDYKNASDRIIQILKA